MENGQNNRLGTFIIETRQRSGLNQAQLAKKANIPAATLSRTEQGRCIPNPATLRKILEALNVNALPEDISIAPRSRRIPANNAMVRPPLHSIVVYLSMVDEDNLKKSRELLGINTHSGVVQKALKLLRLWLDKTNDGFVIRLHNKDGTVIELNIL